MPGRKSGQKGKTMDYNKTIDFFVGMGSLCSSRLTCKAVAHDEQCPLYDFCSLTHSKICAKDAKKAIEILQKWSNEHPKKTYAQDFFEKFPKAQGNSDGTPFVCRKRIYGGMHPTFENCDYTGACRNC